MTKTFFVRNEMLIPELFSDVKNVISVMRYGHFYVRVNALAFYRNSLRKTLFLNLRYSMAIYIFSETLKNSLFNDTHFDKIGLIFHAERARQKSQTPALWRRKWGLRDLLAHNLSAEGDCRWIKLSSLWKWKEFNKRITTRIDLKLWKNRCIR